MVIASNQTTDPTIKALKGEIAEARDPQILRIVATVDAMATRGQADMLIAPLRQRLSMLRPPRPLRFVRLLFNPLDALIVPTQRWRAGDHSIPRTVLGVMAHHVRQAMRDDVHAIEHEIAGHTDADADLIMRWGRSLWPAAARIFGTDTIPETWATTGLGVTQYRPLADCIAALLEQAPSLDAICTNCANGLLPVDSEAIATMLDRVMRADPAALPMMIALLLVRLPEAAGSVLMVTTGVKSPMKAAMDQGIDRLLQQMNLDGGTEELLGTGSLSEAGVAANQIKTLLTHLDGASNKPQRREQLRTIRQRLDASCKARFTSGLESELLAPLRNLSEGTPDQATINGLEAAARSLRVLEMEARAIGSGATYDLMLRRASDFIKSAVVGERLSAVEQSRLVEFLAGPEAALAMLSPSA